MKWRLSISPKLILCFLVFTPSRFLLLAPWARWAMVWRSIQNRISAIDLFKSKQERQLVLEGQPAQRPKPIGLRPDLLGMAVRSANDEGDSPRCADLVLGNKFG